MGVEPIHLVALWGRLHDPARDLPGVGYSIVVAGREGLEPPLTDLESASLPLADRPLFLIVLTGKRWRL